MCVCVCVCVCIIYLFIYFKKRKYLEREEKRMTSSHSYIGEENPRGGNFSNNRFQRNLGRGAPNTDFSWEL